MNLRRPQGITGMHRKNSWAPAARLPQRGAATLVVVMILFLIMAMMAAFASRNQLFEQRIASNYYRTGVALEAGEAGAEWALSMLNGIAVDAACTPSSTGGTSFRQRYLTIDSGSRGITPINYGTPAVADCVRKASGAQDWTCQCPSGPLPVSPLLTEASRMQPRFAVSLRAIDTASPIRPGVVRMFIEGCTASGSTECQSNSSYARAASLGLSQLYVDIALLSALKAPPASPLVAMGTVGAGAAGLGLHNTDPRSGGLLLSSLDANPSGLLDSRLDSLPGTPGRQALLLADPSLLGKQGADLFKMFFGMAMVNYQNQPAMRTITCPQGDCGPALLAAYNSGVRLAWVAGPLVISSNITLGTATEPLLLVADGAVALQGPMQLTGLLFSNGNLDWANSSAMPAVFTGAMIVAGNTTVTGTVDLWYQAAVMDQLSNRAGSFVRIPGGWWN
ncbi:pilus assembly PilX family protein [Roseateles koreensis]|uniref:Type 4 fimbrial biogenesis protein PilX N-terminal domain-containing protein n=1 Tax=Roseateles koreensis TaxID=2987526 RepID=A0ABT5KRS7_9BURK|nr:PilX N-terminal domain-containing pilus assembly protein [Roseateles koreensis]MDC8784477.1 hypothetical protein [Roseateles koreensis]